MDAAAALADLRDNWGTAYNIAMRGVGHWLAERRDGKGTVSARTPLDLLQAIRDDYARQPVPR